MISGSLRKMHTRYRDPVEYSLVLDDQTIILNTFLGKKIRFEFSDKITCVACQRQIKKTFNQGYCFPCFRSLAQCDQCIMRPELCHFASGTCRQPEWGLNHCMKPHFIYLAFTSGLKVGLTKEPNIPSRWIDQGAVEALPILRVNSRYAAGLCEDILRESLNDKTNWRRMLSDIKNESLNLEEIAKNILSRYHTVLLDTLKKAKQDPFEVLQAKSKKINYPVLEYPTKVRSLSFDKTKIIEEKLLGIKAQYLIFASGCLNIRKFTGYHINLIF